MTTHPRVTISHGILEGEIDARTGVRAFKGVPFAAPPVGALRWREPQPVAAWHGIRPAQQFAPRPMQLPIFGDMNFRSPGMSEDCLYLNVWTPVEAAQLPVLVYFYGGGNVAGDSSEPRYDGASLAKQGIIVVTVNYRLNIFGFFAHPDLRHESESGACGNYGYLDQTAALRWVQAHIAAFGGDPQRVSIAGESAGSISVSAQMASPLAQGLFAAAIGSSGSLMGALSAQTLSDAEHAGMALASEIGAPSVNALRALPAHDLLDATQGHPPQHFTGTIDGYFLTQSPWQTFANGQQTRVPLLVGWNSTEVPYMFLLGDQAPTVANYQAAVRARFADHADTLLAHYAAHTDADVIVAATDLSSDLFIGHSTWKWADLHVQTSGQPVYRYLYAHPRPPMRPELGNVVEGLAGGIIHSDEPPPPPPPLAIGATHSADIEYFMGNLDTNEVFAWTDIDTQVSTQMQHIYRNFVTHHNPNGDDIPTWPTLSADDHAHIMRIDATSASEPDHHRARYRMLDGIMPT